MVRFYRGAQNAVWLKQWEGRLDAVVAKFPEDREVQLAVAQAAFDAVSDYGGAKNWVALEQWAALLEAAVFLLARAIHDQDSVNQLWQLLASTFRLVQQFRQLALNALWRRWELDATLAGPIKSITAQQRAGDGT